MECFCPALIHSPSGAAAVDLTARNDHGEIIAADVRLHSEAAPREIFGREQKGQREHTDLMKLKLFAAMMGVGLDDLVRRDEARALAESRARARRLKTLASAFAIVALAAIVAGLVALRQKGEADRQKGEADRQRQLAVAGAQRAERGEAAATQSAAEAHAAEADAEAAEADAVRERELARQALANSALSLAEAARREANGPEMQSALGDVPEDLRDSTWNYLLEQSDTSCAHISSVGAGVAIEGAAADPRRPGVFAVSQRNNKIALIDVHSGERLFEFTAAFNSSGRNRLIAFSPDGQRIAVGRAGGGTNGIAIHSAANGNKLLEWPAPGSSRLEFSPDGSLLLQEESDNSHLSMWDASAGKLVWDCSPSPPDSRHVYAAFTADGKQVLTYSANDQFRVVNATDGKLVRRFKRGRHPATMTPALGGNKLVATSDALGSVEVYDLQTGGVLSEFSAHGVVGFLGFMPDGEQIVTAAALADGRQAITVWQARTGDRVRSLLGGSGEISGGYVHPLTGELLVCGPNTRAWSLAGKPATWEFKASGRHIRPVFWGSDDFLFAHANGADCALQKLLVGSSTVLWKPGDVTPRMADVSADGTLAALADDSRDNRRMVLLRNPGPTPEGIRAIKVLAGFDFVRLSPTGNCAAVILGHSSQFELFDTATGEQPVKLDRADVKHFRDVGWLAGGKQLVALVTAGAERGDPGSEERIILWDAATGKIVKSMTNRSVLGVLAVAPDGSRFAEGGADKMVRIRDAATLAVQREFRAHDGPITAMAWHPGKPILATASADLTVKLWNLETGRHLEEFDGHLYAPNGLAFSPSGQRLACSIDGEGTFVWEPPSLSDRPATTQPADAWEDLLATLTPETVEQAGNGWRMEDGALLSPGKGALLALPGNFARASYQLHVKLRQLEAKSGFHLEFPVADRMLGFGLAGGPAKDSYTGLETVNGRYGRDLPGTVHGKVVNDSEQHDLGVTVRLFGTGAIITVTLDAQPLYEWSGPTTALSSSWHPVPGTFNLGTYAADWVVYEATAKRQ